LLSFVRNRNHGDKEKKTIVKMLFRKDLQRPCIMKKSIPQRFTKRK
jgi:hypothetical protein